MGRIRELWLKIQVFQQLIVPHGAAFKKERKKVPHSTDGEKSPCDGFLQSRTNYGPGH